MTGVLTDAKARALVRTSLDATLFVDAGAGTGKTTALVERVLQLVAHGVPVSSIAAITFTEAAATELRDRLRSALDDAEAAGAAPAGSVEALDEAAISTLHGFAQRLLAAAPLQAGVPPQFSVLDETGAVQAFERRWYRFCSEAEAAPPSAALLERALAAGVSYRTLFEVAQQLHQAHHRLPDPEPPEPVLRAALAPVDVAPAVAALRDAAAFADLALDPTDTLCLLLTGDALPGFTELAHDLEAAPTDADRIELLAAIAAMPTSAKGRKSCWGEHIEDVRTARDAACEAVDTLISGVRSRLVPALTSLLCRFVRAYAAERRRAGTLEFHDLLVAARDLLRHSPEVRQRLSARYERLLIDEFQDTDPLQVELALLLTGDGGSVGTTHGPIWEELEPVPGRLFFVGDAKQSIYRFRKADLQLFHQVRTSLGAEEVVLHNNFRSVPGILSCVNAIFGVLLGESTSAGQAAPQALTAARVALPGDAPVRALGGVFAEVRAVERREAEAADVAAILHDAHHEGWTVSAGTTRADGTETIRAARWSDMAVLLPTRTSLPQLEAALVARDVPFRVDSASLVWQSAPVRDVLLVLQALVDPNDAVALVGALRSPLLGCPDESLLEYHASGGRWEGWPWRRVPADHGLPPDHPVLVALDALRALSSQRDHNSIGAFADLVVRRLGAFEVATANRRPRDHWRRLRFLVEEARAFDHASGGTLADFVTWCLLQSSDEARIREPVLPEDDDDAVQILTVHGAKGREFPICVLSGLGQAPNTTKPRVLWDAEGLPVVSFRKDIADAAYGELAEIEAELADHERIRLLYVAATRARDHLVVCLHRSADDDARAATAPRRASLAARLAEALDAAPADELVPGAGQSREARATGAGSVDHGRGGAAVAQQLPGMAEQLHAHDTRPLAAAWQAEEEAWHNARQELLRRGAHQSVVAATTLAARVARRLPPLDTGAEHANGDHIGLLTDTAAGTETPAVPDDHDESGGSAVDGAGTDGATGLSEEVGRAEDAGSAEPSPDAPAWRRGRAGTAIGRAVHATLQLADLADPASAVPLAAAQAAAEGIDRLAGRVTALARAALASDVVRAAVAARHWREVYLAAPVGATVVEGFIDLLYETPEGLVVVDYKTDAVPDDAAIEAALPQYRLQLATYALLVTRTTARPVAGAALVFLAEHQARTHWIADLDDAVTEVRSTLERSPKSA
jgi:ATP-dependent helicase/nuclease subunit A